MSNALHLAIEALEYHTAQTRPIERTQQAIAALRDAIEQKPVAYKVNWPVEISVGSRRFYGADEWENSRKTVEFLGGEWTPLYASPQPAAPQPVADLQAPAVLPESMSRDKMLRYYSEYANLQSVEALQYQKRIRDLEAKLVPQPVAVPDASWAVQHNALSRAVECLEILNQRPRPMCRDCADCDGACQNSGLDCNMTALFSNCRDALAKLAAAPQAPSREPWQPIETAPKDGTAIWAFNGEQAQMQWIEGEGFALWAWVDEVLTEVDPCPDQPTHWMPLPAAPGITKEGGKQ